MTRSLVGMAAATLVAFSPVTVSAHTHPQITVSREKDQATIVLERGDLTVTQTLAGETVDLRLVQGADHVRLTADLEGRVRMERGERQHQFSMRTATPADQAAITALLAGSAAVPSFDAVMQSEWARTTKAAQLFTSARALLGVLQGDYQPVARMAAAVSTPAPTLMFARQRMSPSQCWDTYSRDVVYFTYELQRCMVEASYSLNPLRSAWCAYEYNLKSSLSAFWLLDCYGI